MPGFARGAGFLLLALLAEVAGTVGGFGSSVFFVPIANFYFDFQSVLGITALFHLASNLSKLGLFRAGIDRGLLLRMGLPAVAFALLGGLASAWIETRGLTVLLALFLIALSGWMLLRPRWKVRASAGNAVLGGVLSGGMAGLVGTGGAVRGAVMAAFDLRKDVFVATSAAIDLAIDLSRAAVYARNGYIHSHDLVWIPLLAVVALAGTWLGRRILARVPQALFRRIALLLVLAIGLVTLGQAAVG
ncbi:sulfite exporter TauE/SafE family protein [Thermomonas alba]|uniref:sulfite exporter TauE/SafE family protein n=1 Tax=Thermomonas alba TaxID=2888525 RepID=UPI001F0418F9|nr:sulfite exporter TauE/SafE family protein [Thermomonas alba]